MFALSFFATPSLGSLDPHRATHLANSSATAAESDQIKLFSHKMPILKMYDLAPFAEE